MGEPHDRATPSFSFGRRPKRGEMPQVQLQPQRSPSRAARPAASPPGEGTAAPASPSVPVSVGFPQWVGAPRATLVIVFTDIVGSAALTRKLGNRAMDEIRRSHFQRARSLAGAHSGYVVKTMGDSVMAAFRAASDALDFALAIHGEPGDPALRVRAGIHVGPVTIEDQDAHGTTVNYAARVVATPRGAEVWLSSEAKGHVDQEGAAHHAALPWQAHGDVELKGFPGRHVLWSVGTG